MVEPGRKFVKGSSKYRYGFNGKENDNEVKGDGNQQDYGMRIYDPRIGKFLSVDPLNKQYPYYTPYSFAGNKPIKHIDLDGLEEAKNWADYNFIDLMNWISKPSSPLKDGGFAHSLGSSFNRNFNPIYYGYVITTGKDPSSSDYGKMGRVDAAANLTTMLILHKSLTVTTAPTQAVAFEQQMAKNEAAMGSSAAAKSVVNDESTAASSGQKANRGRGTALENQNNSAAQNFESGAEGAASDVLTKKRIVPTLKYDNPNLNGKDFIKFDANYGELNFIDRKLNVTGFPKSIDQITRAAEALRQNPGSTLRYEVPQNKVNAMYKLIRNAGQMMNTSITVQAVPIR